MFKVHALQAAFGDSLILEFGTPLQKRFVLIDGGPDGIYAAVLREKLAQIGAGGGRLERIILTHVDGDHVEGLLSLFSELRANLAPIAVDALWHNSFAKTIDDGPHNIAGRIQAMLANVPRADMVMGVTTNEINLIPQGDKLRQDALVLGIPFNDGMTTDLVSLDTSPGPLTWGNLTVTVVGPTKTNLDKLKEEWLKWLETQEGRLATGDPFLAAMADQSKPNLSSIMLHVKDDTGKTALFTGDGRGDHLLQGLGEANLLSADDKLHVNVFKLPHHGSDQNVTKTFFTKVTADEYIASANGRNGNPDYSTLSWLITTAKDQNRPITIHVTNATKSTDDIQEDFDPQKFGYTLKVRPSNQSALTVLLS